MDPTVCPYSLLVTKTRLCQRVSIRVSASFFNVSTSVFQHVSIFMSACQHLYFSVSSSLCKFVSIRMSACQLAVRSTLEATATKVMIVFSLSPNRCTTFLLRCDLAEVDVKVWDIFKYTSIFRQKKQNAKWAYERAQSHCAGNVTVFHVAAARWLRTACSDSQRTYTPHRPHIHIHIYCKISKTPPTEMVWPNWRNAN